jgi:uncharacterized protein YjiS (DUF1127 family)
MSAQIANTRHSFDMPQAAYAPAVRRPGGLLGRLSAVAQWVADMPRRRAVINELDALSDHELADIGLARVDVPRVFDRDFVSSRVVG